MRSYLAALLTLLLVIMTSCGGGGSKSSPTTPSGSQTSGIQGPDSIQEGQSAQYSIERIASASATYRWTVDPPAFGTFTNPQASSTELTANTVTAD
ncbi:hypothetical protein KAU08_02100, partial [bacterium]|nr:hypothetical protein [bacterium]